MNTNSVLCIAKIVNPAGKYEILESADHERIAVGKIASSNLLAGRDLGSTWRVNIRLTDKASLKVDSVERYDISAITVANVTATPTNEPAGESVNESTVVSGSAHSAPMTLDRDIADWQLDTYYISPRARLGFGVAYQMLKTDAYRSVKIMMTGASGLGKTTVAQKFAEFIGFGFLRVNCATMLSTTDWFGLMSVEEQNGAPITRFVPSEFAAVAQRGNCVIVLDEINRISPEIHNSLFPLLDDSQATNVYGIDIALGPNVIIVGTANIGLNYTGVFPLDQALVNRFELTLEMEYLPFDVEIDVLRAAYPTVSCDAITQIVAVAKELRLLDVVCSTRTTLLTARMVASGLTVRQAYEFSVVLRLADDDTNARKNAVDAIVTVLGDKFVV